MTEQPPKRRVRKKSNGAVRLADVANVAGVSTATVSRALNQPDRVSETVRLRVESAIQKLGWVPNASARNLASNRTRTLGIVIPTLDHQNFARMVEALQHHLLRHSFTLLVGCAEYDPDLTARHARTMVERGVEGLFLVGADHPDDVWRLLETQQLPHVLLYTSAGAQKDHDYVGFDNYRSFASLTRHLIDLGHREFGVISQPIDENDRARARLAAIKDTLAEEGLAVRPERLRIEQNWKIADGRHGFRSIMETPRRPTVVMCGNDYLACGALLEANAMGIAVPDAVSVTGFDDIELSTHMSPPLTTMKVPDDDIGRIAGERMIAILEKQPAPALSALPVELILRGSTAAPLAQSLAS